MVHNTNKSKKLFNLLLIFAGTFFSLIIVEGIFYFFYPISYRMPPKQLPDNVWHELLHRPSAIPGIAYELVPNREKYAQGALVDINSFGMRDDEPHPKEDHSLHRIAALGDSFTFGFGVNGEHTYSNVLEQLLNEKEADQYEVLNFGVGGYSTYDEALVLQYKAMAWDLDYVVIGYFFNDPEIDPIQPLHSYYQEVKWWQRSNLLRLIAKTKNQWDIQKYGNGDYFRYLHSANGRKWQSVVDSLEEIISIAETKNIPVLLVIFPITENAPWTEYPYLDLHQQIANTARETGICVIDLFENFSLYPGHSLMVGPYVGDPHPHRFGHELAASAIYEWIAENNGTCK